MSIENFDRFSAAVERRFGELAQGSLYVVDADRDEIWQRYLESFPCGTDPVFRKRTEHDCSCCRSFVRDIGAVVGIQNGALSSVWDLNGLPSPYQEVADAMSEYVKALAIRDAYLTKLELHGTPVSHEVGLTWKHFSVKVPRKFICSDVAAKQGDMRTSFAVLLRGCTELKPEALETVAGLISANMLYRGQEFERQVEGFRALQSRVASGGSGAEVAVWAEVDSPVARFRNTAMGTLVQDLSEGMDLERAVRSFESKVAPQSYKRPTALITQHMVRDAMKTIADLGLEPALERRHARISDVSVSSVLFVDNAVRSRMKGGGIADLLMESAAPPKFDPKKASPVSIEAFLRDVLPKTKSLQLYLDNPLLGSFVSLTAPVHEDAPRLFKWDNGFAWSYDGNVADGIKDRVKSRGGRVDGVALRASLAWFNTDDLDIHAIEPNGSHIYYGNKQDRLDVDMNVGDPVRDAVENIRWPWLAVDGKYRIYVNNFRKRESVDVGFVVEVEHASGLETLSYKRAVRQNENVDVCTISVRNGAVERVVPADDIVSGSISQEKWGLKTLQLARVDSVIESPNHWDGNASGNKHWFFVLDGCRNPLPTRGIYNEFLKGDLEKHRKVFEVLGEKTKCPYSDDQLSGIGISSTRKDRVTVLADRKPYTIEF